MKKGILIAFGELFLKSPGVKNIFKKKLIQNLYFFLKKNNLEFKIFSGHERIFVSLSKPKSVLKTIKNIFGISWFAEAWFFENSSLKEISEFIAENYQDWIKENESFAIRLKRGSEIKESRERIIGKIAKKIKRKVDLTKPHKEIFIEARKEGWYIYFKKKEGNGGLPVSTAGKVLSLISGGIDSPVASFLMAKRGAENVWLHFHSFPFVSSKSIEKVKQLAKIFLNYQQKLKVYFFPFSKIQMEIKSKILPKYRILFYRRIMLKIAQKIAKKEKCYAIVTGESLGQVSSQTLPNLEILEKPVTIPILRPLIGMDKEEIIKIAKKIKTLKISVLPQEDCCSLFTPKHATAKGNLKEIERLEKKLNLKPIIKEAQKQTEIFNF